MGEGWLPGLQFLPTYQEAGQLPPHRLLPTLPLHLA